MTLEIGKNLSVEDFKMTDEQIENVAFAIWQTDYPLLKLPDWVVYSERVKKLYYTRAKAAIKAYKACLKEGV